MEMITKVRIKTVDGVKMPFRVDFDSEEEFDAAVTEWNKMFIE